MPKPAINVSDTNYSVTNNTISHNFSNTASNIYNIHKIRARTTSLENRKKPENIKKNINIEKNKNFSINDRNFLFMNGVYSDKYDVLFENRENVWDLIRKGELLKTNIWSDKEKYSSLLIYPIKQ